MHKLPLFPLFRCTVDPACGNTESHDEQGHYHCSIYFFNEESTLRY